MAKRIPASIRNNNPGAMYPGPSAKKFGARTHEVLKSKDGVHKIATFATPIQGAAAQFDLLASSKYTGRSIEDAIQKWCGGFYVSTYIKVLEGEAKVSRNTTLTRDLLCDARVAIPLAKAMALQEAGQPFPMSDEDWLRAHAMAFPDAQELDELPPEPATDKEWFDEANDLPSPKPETRVKETLKGSRTIFGALLAIIGTIVQWFHDAVTGLVEAAGHVASWAPATSLLASIGVNIKGIGLSLALGGIGLVVMRRLSAAKNGKVG